MGLLNIQWGDTLSGIAQRVGSSVDALMKANPQIQDANLIYAGRQLKIPGATDGFDRGGGRTGPDLGGGGVGPAENRFRGSATGNSGDALSIARAHLGENAGSLKLSGSEVGRAMEDWVPNNVNCANFVSGVLRSAGQISSGQQSASVYGLMGNLDRDASWSRTSLANAQPGDVVSMRTPGGQHVVMFAGMENGRPLFIGSNNVNPDGSQRISYSHFNYPILAVHHYNG